MHSRKRVTAPHLGYLAVRACPGSDDSPQGQPADTALVWIQSIVPEADLDATAMRLAHLLAGRRSPAQRELKTLLHRIEGLTPDFALRAELDIFAGQLAVSRCGNGFEAVSRPTGPRARPRAVRRTRSQPAIVR